MISNRAKELIGNIPALVLAHFKCHEAPYHATQSPTGYINFGTAENHLLWPKIEPVLNNDRKMTEKGIHYDYSYGSLALRSALACYMQSEFGSPQHSISPERIVVSAGASSILDILMASICEAGDGVLIPAPYYSGFDVDLKLRCDVQPVPIHLDSTDGFELSIDAIQKTLNAAKSKGISVKAILLSNPNNPIGTCYSEKLVREIAEFSKTAGIHCIFDEIYGNSLIGGSKHYSALQLSPDWDHVHYVSGLAKDFSLSGFKVGYFHSYNNDLLSAVRQLTYVSPVSTYTQWKVEQLFSDPQTLRGILDLNHSALTHACELASQELKSVEVPFNPPQGGQFIFMNLSRYLDEPTFDAEKKLWQKLFDQARVSMTPGNVFHNATPGWFRLCFAHRDEVLLEGIERIKSVLV